MMTRGLAPSGMKRRREPRKERPTQIKVMILTPKRAMQALAEASAALQELQTLLVREKLEGRVFLPGWNADLPGVLAAASLIVIPSRWEGMPNVLLEAMASRRPVVATRVEGVAEVLGPLAESQSVEWGDAAGFAAKVTTLALDSQLAESLGRANADRVERHFTLDAMVQTYESLYEGDA